MDGCTLDGRGDGVSSGEGQGSSLAAVTSTNSLTLGGRIFPPTSK